MGSAKVVGRLLIAVAVTSWACGGDGSGTGVTDPKVDTTKVKTPVDTAAVNLAARIATTNTLLTIIDDGMSAVSQSAGVGGVPTSAPPMHEGNLVSGATLATAPPPPPPPDAAKCTYEDATAHWNCPDFKQQDSTTIKTWFQFLDDKGEPHKFVDSVTTVAIRRFVQRSGAVKTQHTSQAGTVPAVDTVFNADTLVLSGIKGPPEGRKLNGKGMMKHVVVPEGQSPFHVTATTTTENFAFTPPAPAGSAPAPRYPISGKVTGIVTGYSEDKPTQGSTTTQVTTYDGTKIAKLVITTQQGQVLRTCTWDMTAANVAPSCS